VLGRDPATDGAQIRARLGVVPQQDSLDGELTVLDNLVVYARYFGYSRADSYARARRLLEFASLTERADSLVEPLSRGMKRRLTIARSLVNDPEILLLDEPTTGLDPQSRNALWEEVGRLAKEDGVTVFLTTQYLEEADVLADRVGIIDHGRIVAEGTPSALKGEIGRPTVEASPHDTTELGAVEVVLERFGERTAAAPGAVAVLLDGKGDLADVVRALDAEGVRVNDLRLHAPSLDDVFLAKTGRKLEGEDDELGSE
jgi:ABC-type multidrug transport system ATPase subunit